MTELPPDADQRSLALAPATSFIVRAPAGSGKTELLTQRFLALLGHVQHPEEILAITFTKKATAEMRVRICDALDDARAPAGPGGTYVEQRRALAARVVQRDKELGWELQRNPNRLRIQTIDALCAWLTRRLPLLSGFGMQAQILEDADPLYRAAARNTLTDLESGEAWSEPIAKLLQHLDNDLPRLEDLLTEMLGRRDQWIRHLGAASERVMLEEALQEEICSALRRASAAVPLGSKAVIVELAQYAAANLQSRAPPVPIAACVGLTELPPPETEALPRWCGIAALLLTKTGEWRRRVGSQNGFPTPRFSTEADKQRARTMKDTMNALLEDLATRTEPLRVALAALRELPPPAYSDSQWMTTQALFELLRLGLAHLALVFAEQKNVDFPQLGLAALKALGEPEAPTDLALALDHRISHLLVDEFQDTSYSQFDLLKQLTTGWESGDGRTLFLVGDPMQSIYRFREAEVGLFLNAWERQRLGQVPLMPLELSANFRSSKGIVNWVNHCFDQVMAGNHLGDDAPVPYTPSVTTHFLENEGVSIHPFFDSDHWGEAQKVLTLVKEARERDESVAVLARTRLHLRQVTASLNAAGLRYQAIEIAALAERPLIQDLTALTLALLHPADRIAWLSVLRAPWCGLSLADLHALAAHDHRRCLWDLLREAEDRSEISRDGQERVRRLRVVFQVALAKRRRGSLRRWVEGTWLALGGPACITEETDFLDARAFFDKLAALEQGADLPERQRLGTLVAAAFAAPDSQADPMLQLMTIHKAKGLEFDTVIVPGLGRSTRGDQERLLLWMERPRASGRNDLLLALLPETPGNGKQEIYHYLQHMTRAQMRAEQKRLLYVAVTRARRQLHLLGRVATRAVLDQLEPQCPRPGTLLHDLWPMVETQFRQSLNVRGPEAEPILRSHPLQGVRRLSLDWALPPPPAPIPGSRQSAIRAEGSIEFRWAGSAARHVGTVVHRFLQVMAAQGPRAWDLHSRRVQIARSLTTLGVPDDALQAAVDKVLDALSSTLADPRGRWILSPEHQDAHNEYALGGVLGGEIVHAVIDRSFIDREGIRWIIDYKTGTHLGADPTAFTDNEQQRYQGQLERYAVLMGGLEQRPIRLGLYFPLLTAWREWEPAGTG
ncbi:MAG: UvrD-helicase domain-containing protein [Gammaproteobacteria bacterium]